MKARCREENQLWGIASSLIKGGRWGENASPSPALWLGWRPLTLAQELSLDGLAKALAPGGGVTYRRWKGKRVFPVSGGTSSS